MSFKDYTNNTISAISTPRGEGGIGIVRMSGPSALFIAESIFKPRYSKNSISQADTHTLLYGHIINPKNHEILDEVLLTVMKAPRTYTKEDIVEINCHGGSIPLSKVLELTLEMGARLAEPGEFTRRAFINGRIDLTQAEAVADIIRAKTELSLKVSMEQLQGRLADIIGNIRSDALELMTYVEASIDFPDEDLDFLSSKEIIERLKDIIYTLDKLLATANDGKFITEGIKGVIIGRPNVGKSSLFNALLHENRAIVTSIPGTTRDTIEEFINLYGVPLKLTDTAGLHHAEDTIEIESMERTRVQLDKADIILLVLDSSDSLTEDDRQLIDLVKEKKTLVILNKSDLPRNIEKEEIKRLAGINSLIEVSAINETGLDRLKSAITGLTLHKESVSTDTVFITKLRHKISLEKARENFEYALQSAKDKMPPELISVDLRGGLRSLDEITGKTSSAEILDQVFSRFCIGK
ncbi:tRNA uridine-5-carboxymethylaminomethyl(34) synthesis GTPase MnmE [Candidatus Poribacteria bacterium]|nr:tRNA uridine-5-carboxymethylaminomethyl(34) synthesis GTPase MnmE [Candidatus Poribacteria bacterium]